MKNKKNQKGQSTVEFLMTFVFVFGIMIIYVKIAFNFTKGYMVHYANYQASRAFLVSDRNKENLSISDSEALADAIKVWKKYYVEFSAGGDPTSNAPDFGGRSIFVGTVVDYKEIFAFGFPFSVMDPMDMKSESFLGREPTRKTCLERTCRAMQDVGASAACQRHMTLDDNGC